ncbi:MAG TPA: ABC transporter permease [Candidatus Limnocylindrales bacterium]|nr:ABC transporter permease [Candidatus Limnocylindrales bacterium]
MNPRSRLRASDLLPVGSVGLRTRHLRAVLSVLGIGIGVASLVAVLGIAASSQADLLGRIDRLGTNLLTVVDGQSIGGTEVPLPMTAPVMIGQIDGVTAVAPTAELTTVHVYRHDLMPSVRTGGMSVRAADIALLSTLEGSLSAGGYLTAASERKPVAVLGSQAAQTLGDTPRVWISGHWFTVGGVLNPLPLAPEIDRSVLIGFAAAGAFYGHDGHASRIYVRSRTELVESVAAKLARTANPANPVGVRASRPSDALTARLEVARSGTGLFLGLGGVALLVGALGIANLMVIAVLERRTEIGLRRALGARRGHIAAQFLTESLLLAFLGGVCGVVLGVAATAIASLARDWTVTVPALAVWGGLGAALLIGALAGLYPATRAARLAPTDALRTT